MSCLVKSTGDSSFWEKKENYISQSEDEFNKLKQKIHESFNNLNIPYSQKDPFAVAYVISFGTFVTLFKNIKLEHKEAFIKKYSKKLYKKDDYRLLHKYFLCIKALRNRCAHGTHIVSISFVNQLNQFNYITKVENVGDSSIRYSVFDLTLEYLIDTIYCSTEFKTKLLELLKKRRPLYSKYGGKQSINPSIIEKLDKK